MAEDRKSIFRWSMLPRLLPMGILAGALWLFVQKAFPLPAVIRETVIGVAWILFVAGSFGWNWVRKRNLISELRLLGGLSLLLWAGLRILSHSGDASGPVPDSGGPDIGSSLFSRLVFLGVLVLSVWIFNVLRELVFIQQGKSTKRNFMVLVLVIFLRMALALVMDPADGFDGEAIPEIPLVFMFVFSAINGFRCKWIHFLRKKQKLGVFLLGLTIVLFSESLIRGAFDTLVVHSAVMGVFIQSVLIFYLFYVGMALLGIALMLPSAGLMDRKLRQIRSLQDLSSAIGSKFDRDDLVKKSVELCTPLVGADGSWFERKRANRWVLWDVHGVDPEQVETIPEKVRDQLRQQSLTQSDVVLVQDVNRIQNVRVPRKGKRKAGSLLVAPVRFQDSAEGILWAIKKETFGFTEESRDLFRAAAQQIAMALENTRLIRKTIEQEVYREELRVAHDAQMRLLPRSMPRMPGVDCDAFCFTANEIGGDFYDMIQVGQGRLDIVVGDVSGKGAEAAFAMAELKGVIQALAPHFTSPKDMLLEINSFVRNHFRSDVFATLVYAIFWPSRRRVCFVRAGHPPILWIRGRGCDVCETGGVGLGLSDTASFRKTLKQKVITLDRGDALFFCTDGILEARNTREEEFGEQRLQEILLTLRGKGAEETLKEIHRRLESFTRGKARHDDMTAVIVRLMT
jgi:sigma-B regulation protein RsbU (phosphoserine phosphatase)